jgi:hypothetical protein
VLADRAPVLARARAAIQAAGLTDRIDLVPTDFFERVPADGDRYVLSWIIHDWADADATRILDRCREAMPAGARLLLIESDSPEGDARHLSRSMDIAMLVGLGGRERTAAEYRRLLAGAKLRLDRVIPTTGPMSVFEARPA